MPRKDINKMDPQYNPQPQQPQTQPTTASEAQTPATPQANPVFATPVVSATPYVANQKKGLAITALVLAILSVVFGIAWFIAAPLALVAIILAIVSLAKKRGGKGLSIAGLVIGSISLFILVPIWLTVSLVALEGLQDKANNLQTQSELSE